MGVEVWNIETGTVQTIVNQMPREISYSIQRGTMISISDNTELVFFGGWAGSFLSEVWKYNYPKNKWEMVGHIQNGRSQHLTIPVKRLECP
jgi:hypothetical protein